MKKGLQPLNIQSFIIQHDFRTVLTPLFLLKKKQPIIYLERVFKQKKNNYS